MKSHPNPFAVTEMNGKKHTHSPTHSKTIAFIFLLSKKQWERWEFNVPIDGEVNELGIYHINVMANRKRGTLGILLSSSSLELEQRFSNRITYRKPIYDFRLGKVKIPQQEAHNKQ